ncbi:hypothetical protein CQW23_01063 [Capsicum baccatum]|uniref:Uncharacterized protein n=1 Tax=Capsicum baccatum TaxID=33114 RepID=A0A2G2XMK0_CAPBA|nr:hypothetical protein CQW23_01063 [Capsicum baccatum]
MSAFLWKKGCLQLERELVMKSWASIRTKLKGLTVNRVSSFKDDVEVILNVMSGMGADIFLLRNLLGSSFELGTSYNQARSTLVNKTAEIEKLEPHLKAKEYIELMLKEKDVKS